MPAYRFSDIPADDASLEGECEISFLRASGPGGQHRNKTETAVRLVHRATGISVVASEERSQSANRRRALSRLRVKLVRALKPRKARRATGVPAGERRRRLEQKKRRGETKRLRRAAPEA